MSSNTSKPPTNSSDDAPKPQPDMFRDLARELGCDEDEAAFEDTVRRVANASRPPNTDTPDEPQR